MLGGGHAVGFGTAFGGGDPEKGGQATDEAILAGLFAGIFFAGTIGTGGGGAGTGTVCNGGANAGGNV